MPKKMYSMKNDFSLLILTHYIRNKNIPNIFFVEKKNEKQLNFQIGLINYSIYEYK